MKRRQRRTAGLMVGKEDEALMFAVRECAMNGTEWQITDSQNNLVWEIERDTKVDEDDLAHPVIVHMRGALGSDQIAVLTEVVRG